MARRSRTCPARGSFRRPWEGDAGLGGDREDVPRYNAGRLREGARLLSERMLKPDVTVGLSLNGALTPAGLGVSCVVRC